MNTLILGIGNVLLCDEGIGIHVIHALEKELLPEGVDLLDGGTGGFHLISWIEHYQRIIMVDASLDANPPGTIRTLNPKYASDFPPLISAHEIGLKDMIEAMELSGTLPDIELIIVSAARVDEVGLTLTPEVEQSIPKVIEQIRKSL